VLLTKPCFCFNLA